MNVPPEVDEVLRQWVRKAEHDLEAATRIMAIEEGCPFDTVCFHCQQAAEKYLKCLLTYLGIQAPRTHDSASARSAHSCGTVFSSAGRRPSRTESVCRQCSLRRRLARTAIERCQTGACAGIEGSGRGP